MGDEWDTCQNWDEKTLKDIVEANEKTYKSQIPSVKVCDYFLDALEKGKYGWRWVCPNGMTCHYKHCLPQGYVFRKKEEPKQRQEGDLEEEQMNKFPSYRREELKLLKRFSKSGNRRGQREKNQKLRNKNQKNRRKKVENQKTINFRVKIIRKQFINDRKSFIFLRSQFIY
ncbi:unnamed protein product [Paramecium octaurelia]|uniref:C3H1-type domain-containing protein n=1 Tax=Paramecium octaurelia TaxID=43137 RepID=A0A8S1RUZ2_PAROT|nr:unnamed protein product [Paramecium octaurelia]